LAGSGISFIVGIILARLLPPEVFGLIGMVTVFFAIANTFIDSGFNIGLIRKVKCTNLEYNTVFYFNIAVSTFIYLLLFASAPYISVFFKQPQLTIIIRVLSSVIVIDSFSLVQRVILTRDINFRLQTKISVSSSVTSGIIGIAMAYSGYGVWSLVAQTMSRQLINGALLWGFSKWRPGASFSRSAFFDLFHFGSKILGANIISSIQNNIYYFIIGKFFNAASLGFYTRAEQFNAIVVNNITGTVERVFFPVLSSIQEDEDRIKATQRKMLRTSFFITYFSLMAMAIIAKPLIFTLIGPKWEQSVIYLQLLCIGSVFFPFNVVNMNILKIKGRSDLILRLQVIKTILTAIIVIVGIIWGITSMLVARIITTLFATYLNSKYAGKMIGYTFGDQLRDIGKYFLIETFVLLSIFALGYIPVNLTAVLILQLILGLTLLIMIFERIKPSEYMDIKQLILNNFLKRDSI
jgi:O-antigen/teichoic acid export membrane protein